MAVDTIGAFLLEHDMTVYLVIFDRRAYQISGKLFADIAEYIDDHYVEAHTDPGAERLRRGALHREIAAPMCAPMAAPALTICWSISMRAFRRRCCGSSTAAGKRTPRSIKGQRGPQAVLEDPNNLNYKPSKADGARLCHCA